VANEAGKGDKQRPTNYKSFAENFDAIFRQTKEDAKAEDEEFERVQRESNEKAK
jgi:hypothetical protein